MIKCKTILTKLNEKKINKIREDIKLISSSVEVHTNT